MAEIGSLAVSLTMDATNFNGTISQVDRNLKAMGGELQAVKAKGADYGKSVEGLSQKQGILNRSFDAAGLKLQEQRRRYDELVASGKATDAQIEKQAVAVNKAQAEYNRLEAELKDVTEQLKIQSSQWTQAGQKMQDVGGKIKSVGDGAKNIGKNLTMSVTTPILAMGTAVTKTAMDFEAQMDRVGAIAGATGGEMDKLKKTAMELGASTSKSASEVAIGMENMAAMGFTVNEIMAAMPGIISAAEASGADMAQTADVVASSLNIWGLKATEASKVADILAQTANQSAADITDMQYALKYAGPPAAALGVSLEELSASIGLMSDSGMKGEQAGTTLRSALLSLLDPSEQNSKMMDKMGIQITDAQGNFVGLANLVDNLSKSMEGQTETQKAATLASLVGKEAVSGMLSLMAAGPDTINQLTSSLENSAGASKEAADKMKDNLKGALEELGGSIETASIQLGNVLIPVIRDASQWIQGLVEKFSDLSPEAQKTVLAIGGIAAAAGPLLLIGGTIMSGVGGLVTTVGALSTAIGSAGGLTAVVGSLGTSLSFLAGPIGWTALGVASIGTAAIITAKEMGESSIQIEDWSEKVSESTAKAVGGFMVLSNEASGHLTTLSITGQAVTSEMAANITSIFAEMGQQVLAEMQADHTERLNAITTFYANSNVLIESEENEILAKTAEYHSNKEKQISDGEDRIVEIMNTASQEKRSLTLAEQAEINRIHATMKENAVKYMTETELEQKAILEAMKNNASEISAQQAAEVVKNAISQKDKVIDEAEEQYKKAVAEIIKQRDEMGVISGSQAKQLIEDAGKQRDETIKAAEEMHSKVVTEAKKQAGEHVEQVNWTTGEVKSKWEVMKTDVSTKMKEIGSNIKKDWTTAYNDTVTKLNEMVSSGKTKFNEIKSSVETKMSEVKTKIETKWNESVTFLKGIDLKQIGRDIIDGLIGGIGEKASGLKKKVEELANSIPDWAKKVLGIKSPSRAMMAVGRDTVDGLAVGIEEKAPSIKKKMESITSIITNVAKNNAAEVTKIADKAEADRTKIQETYASKRKNLKKATTSKIQELEKEMHNKLDAINTKAWADMQKKEAEIAPKKLAAIKQYLEDKKSTEQLSLVAEAQIWEQSMAMFNGSTKERIEAQKLYKASVEAVNKELVSINNEYSTKIQKVNEDLAKQEETLTKAYEDAVTKRAQSLVSFKGLFDAFEFKIGATGVELLSNLNSQVSAFKEWQRQIEILSEKAIDKGLLAELREMGPNALPELIALNSMTDTQLTQYSNLYKEKSKLARTQAETELIGMKKDMDENITKLRSAANTQLTTLEKEWNAKIKSLTKTTATELSSLKQIGVDAGQGLLDGLGSMEGQLEAKARSIANSISKTISSALQIKSPSRVMRGFGVNIGEGLVLGMDDMVGKVAGAAQRLATSVEGNMLVGNTSSIDKSRSYTNGDTHIYVYGNNPSPSEIARKNTQSQRQLAMEWGMA